MKHNNLRKYFVGILMLAAGFCGFTAKAEMTLVHGAKASFQDKNTFAFNIRVNSTDPLNPVITYDLAARTSKVVIIPYVDGVKHAENKVTINSDFTMRDNTATVNLAGLPGGRVTFIVRAYTQNPTDKYNEVDFGYVASVNAGKGITFYAPYGVTVNNNTDCDDFGRIIVAESRVPDSNTSSSSTSNTKTYFSATGTGIGDGLYAFNPHLQPYVNSNSKRGFKAGLGSTATTQENRSYMQAKYAPDGRLFLVTNHPSLYPLYVLNNDDLDAIGTEFITGQLQSDGSVVNPTSTTTVRAYRGIGIDFWGNDETLKMAFTQAKDYSGTVCVAQLYDLGAYYKNGKPAATWNRKPTQTFVKKYTNGNNFNLVSTTNTRPLFSPDGFVLYVSQNRSPKYVGDSQPGIVQYDIANNSVINHENLAYSTGMARSLDGTLIARADGQNKISVYNVASDGHSLGTKRFEITDITGSVAANDMAFDIANNLYFTTNAGEYLACYQIGNGNTNYFVDVPAPSKYAYTYVADALSLNATVKTNAGNITLKWERVGLADANSIQIKRDGVVIRTLTNMAATQYVDSDVEGGAHTYEVAYLNGETELKSAQATVSCTTTLDFKALLYGANVNINWTALFALDNYKVKIYQGETPIATLPVNTDGYVLPNAAAPYTFSAELLNSHDEVVVTSNTVSFSLRTEGATVTLDDPTAYSGRSTVTLTWTGKPTAEGLSLSHYSVLCDGQVVYEKIGYDACTHNFVPEGTHEYVVRMFLSDGSFIDSAPKTVYVDDRDYGKPLYSLEEVYNYQIVSPEEKGRLEKQGLYDENKFFVAGYPLNHMRYGMSKYSSSPGDLYRQATFKNGKWYLALLNSNNVLKTEEGKTYYDYGVEKNEQNDDEYQYGPYRTGTGLTDGVTYGGIIAIDANDPKSAYGKKLKDLEVVALDPSTNQIVAIDEAEDNVNIVVRAGTSNDVGGKYTLNHKRTNYMYGATDHLAIFNHNDKTFKGFTGNPESSTLNVGFARPFDHNSSNQRGRVHYLSASGDLSSEDGGGYIYVAYNKSPNVARIRVENNQVVSEKTQSYNCNFISKEEEENYSENYAFPLAHFDPVTLSSDDLAKEYSINAQGNKVDKNGKVIEYRLDHMNDRYFVHQLRTKDYYLVDTRPTNSSDPVYYPLNTPNADVKSAGGHTFVYNDGTGQDMFWVHPRTSTANSFGNFAVEKVNLAAVVDNDNNEVTNFRDAFINRVPVQSFSHEGLQGDGGGNSSGVWFGSEYSEEDNCMYLYQYCPGTRFAKYRFQSYTSYPAVQKPHIVLTPEADGSGYHTDDITHLSNTMSWQRPEKFGATGDAKYNLTYYIVKLVNAAGATVDLNDCEFSYSMIDSDNNQVEGHTNIGFNVTKGDEHGTVNVPDPVNNSNTLASHTTTFTIDYSRSDLRNTKYTLYVTPVYESIVGTAEVIGETVKTEGQAGIIGDAYEVNAQPFKTEFADAPTIYRIDLSVKRPEVKTPVSYYTFEVKKKGESEYQPLTHYFMARNGEHHFYSGESSEPANAPMGVRAKAAGESNLFTSEGKIPGDYNVADEQDYAILDNPENEAKPCMAFLYTTENPEGSVYRLTAHYGATNPNIYVSYPSETATAIPSDDEIVTSVTDALAESSAAAVKAFPVPAHDEVTIQAAEGITSIEIFAQNGSKVFSQNYNGSLNSVKVDIAALSSGFYVVKVNNNSTTRIVKY